MKNIIISPSILNVKKSDLMNKIEQINDSTAEYIHVDVMDGKFVKNESFSFEEIAQICKLSKVVNDVHIMVENPLSTVEKYLDCGADILTFHYEACADINEANKIIDLIHSKNKKAGISVKPNTPVEVVFPLLKNLDLVLVMSVEPGSGGQDFIENSTNKIAALRKEIDRLNLKTQIEVDGGINSITSKKCIQSGVDVLVSGSFICGSGNVQEKINELLK